jgi:hypothetical protein
MSRCDLFLHKGVEGHILFRQDNAEAGDALIGERKRVRSKLRKLSRAGYLTFFSKEKVGIRK